MLIDTLFLVSTLLTTTLTGDESPPRIAELLPTGTLAFVGVDDVDRLVAGARASPWGELLHDPAFAPLFTALGKGWRDLLADQQRDGGIDPVALLAQLHGAAAVAIFDFDRAAEPIANDVRLSGGFICQLKEDAAPFAASIERATVRAEAHGLITRRIDHVDAGFAVVTLTATDARAAMRARIAFVRDFFLCAVDTGTRPNPRDPLLEMIALVTKRGASTTSLGRDASFQTLAGQWPGDGTLTAYLDVGRVVRPARSSVAAPEDSPGVGALGRLLAQLDISQTGIRLGARLELLAGGLPSRFARLMSPCDASMARCAASDVQQFLALGLDLERVLPVLTSVFGELPAPVAALARGGREGLLGAFTGHVGIMAANRASDQAAGELDPKRFTLCLGVADVARFEPQLEVFERSLGWHAIERRESFLGVTLREIPVTPPLCLSVAQGYLLVAFDAEAMRAMVRRLLDPEANPSLARGEPLVAPASELTAAPVLLTSLDSASAWKVLLKAVQRVIRSAPGEPALPIPAGEVVDRHVRGRTYLGVAVDELGIKLIASDRP